MIKNILIIGFFLVMISISFVSVVSANDFGPSAGTKLVLDNIKDFPDYTFFISTASDRCWDINSRIEVGDCIDVSDCTVKEKEENPELYQYHKEVDKQCDLKVFDKSGELLNFLVNKNAKLAYFKYRGQCISPIYAMKKSDFNKTSFKDMDVCKQAEFLEQNATQITNVLTSIEDTSSYFVYLVEEHFNIDLNNTQQGPFSTVEKGKLMQYMFWTAILAGIIIIIIVILKIARRKSKKKR